MHYRLILLFSFLAIAASPGLAQTPAGSDAPKTIKNISIKILAPPVDAPKTKLQEFQQYLPLLFSEMETQSGKIDQGCHWNMSIGLKKRFNGIFVVGVDVEQILTAENRDNARKHNVTIQPKETSLAIITKEKFGEDYMDMIKSAAGRLLGICRCQEF